MNGYPVDCSNVDILFKIRPAVACLRTSGHDLSGGRGFDFMVYLRFISISDSFW